MRHASGPKIVTIDGPSGSGKSTAARELAKRLGFLHLDTGAMYRAVALKALRSGCPLSDARQLGRLSRESVIAFRVDPGRKLRLLLDGEDVTRAIRRPAVTEAASRVAVVPAVRRALVRQQQRIGRPGRVVAEGRDAGTVVFPSAPLKFFLSTDPSQRARRRREELIAAGHRVGLKQVLTEIRRRDRRDRERADSPLRVPKGAIRINNTHLKPAQTLDTMLDYARHLFNNPRS
ncbi:MAG: cytidylate kinase [Candidatus Omnitrophica bacterium CG11_big_fil_rev_8_21_14_0_20_64_10]|nr:MAG: cytidylate kinase [Candidatus Omnitrophica bacterium CG11_big_fil_rev_8_21_14_0_20_64_10]